ncbi:MAG: PstS family phosphate ABC transporter substrate-binding protein [Anaerolineales bacterium]
MLRRMIIAMLLLGTLLTGCRRGPSQGTPSTSGDQSLVNKGSDTMVNIALAWAESYHAANPAISIAVTGGGSGTGIAALINGTVDIANASRQIKPEERTNAEASGVTPVELVVARDAIAVIVHLDNPVDQLTIDQLSAIFSGQIENWSEVGGEDRPIVRLSRETNSGTHVFFLETVVRKGDKNDRTLFSRDTLLLPSSEGITTEVGQNPNAIGYDGLGYVTEDTKVVAVARDAAGPFVLPSAETVENELYPIARDLYMYTAGEPVGDVKAYLDWILSPEAQTIVSDLGFVPLSP